MVGTHTDSPLVLVISVFGPCLQVRGITALLSCPLTTSCDSLEPGITSNFSSVTLPEKQEAEDKVEENEVDNEDKAEEESEAGRTKTRADQTGIYHTRLTTIVKYSYRVSFLCFRS